MASIGEVGAKANNKEDRNKRSNIPQKFFFGVFFDGTGNNMISSKIAKERRKLVKKTKGDKDDWDLYVNNDLENGSNQIEDKEIKNADDAALAYQEQNFSEHVGTGRSNVAILHSCYQGMSNDQRKKEEEESCLHIYNIYIEGAGKNSINDDSKIQDAKNALGSGMGNGKTGVVALVSKAVRMVRLVLDGFCEYFNSEDSKAEIHFDVFGFSRGAACARLFSYVAGRGSAEPLKCESKFSKFQAAQYVENGYMHFLDKIEGLKHDVAFLGIYDTVSSIGITYNNNVIDFGMFSPEESWVKETIHMCAMDEYRNHFALTDINVEKDGNIEVFVPGCHSDIGGGYQIGSESFTLNYRESLTSKYKMFIEHPERGKQGCLSDISCACIEKLGWGYGEEIKEYPIRGHIICSRKKVLAGYSNIPLSIMRWKANEKSKDRRTRFSEFPCGRFAIPKSLSRVHELYRSEIENMTSGRKWIYPGNSYSSKEYKQLRHEYLHFSSTDELLSAHSAIVHSPNIKDGKICRIVYHGKKNSSHAPSYMYDYN